MGDTLSELSKLFRTVSKIVREKTEDYFGKVTDLDRVLREVADEDTCSAPNSLLREIAKATNDIQNYHPIMQNVWQGLAGTPTSWRRIYKSLCLLEFAILLGPTRVYDDARDASMRIRSLAHFRHHDGLREQGGGVRQKATAIVNLLDNPDQIANARAEVLQASEKYTGIENKPAYDFHAGRFSSSTQLPMGPTMSPSWAELGGAFRQPLPQSNPYNAQNCFQTAEDAVKQWGLEDHMSSNQRPPPSLKDLRCRYTSGYDKPGAPSSRDEEIPPDEEVFNTGPDWWSGETVETDPTGAPPSDFPSSGQPVSKQTPVNAPPVMTVNLLDDDLSSPRQGDALSSINTPAEWL